MECARIKDPMRGGRVPVQLKVLLDRPVASTCVCEYCFDISH